VLIPVRRAEKNAATCLLFRNNRRKRIEGNRLSEVHLYGKWLLRDGDGWSEYSDGLQKHLYMSDFTSIII